MKAKRERIAIDTKTDISIIIVNYKVKDYICLLLETIKKIQKDLRVEIFVVDNNSEDKSVEYISSRFENVHFIENSTNKGFGYANNQALIKATGKYTLLINPDTVLLQDSLLSMKNFMDEDENCGAAGFRLINADGSFAKECKRSIPDLKSALFRVLGLDILFSRSKLFGKRFLSWLPENEINKVPVISGAAMFWRTSLLKELNGFDEDFFMYGEDDDLCFRVKNTKYHISYVPITSILHFKGESSHYTTIKSLNKMNKGLFVFFEKHFSKRYSRVSLKLISIAYYIRVFSLYLMLSFKRLRYKKSTKKSTFIIVSKTENSILEKTLSKKKYSLISVPSLKESAEYKDYIISLCGELKSQVKVVFDIDSMSLELIFSIMNKLKDRGIDFHFFDRNGNKIIGKSSVIKLGL